MAKAGVISATLLWRGPEELDLHALVRHACGKREHVSHRSQEAEPPAGVRLARTDGEARSLHIHWDSPSAGKYFIAVQHLSDSEVDDAKLHFQLEVRLPQETLNFGGIIGYKMLSNCCSFVVDAAGAVALAKTALIPARFARRRSNKRLPMPRPVAVPAVAGTEAASPPWAEVDAPRTPVRRPTPAAPLAPARRRPAVGAKAAAAAAAREAKLSRQPKVAKVARVATAISARRKISATVRGARLAKRKVYAGDRPTTCGGLAKEDLMQGRKGAIVFKTRNARGRAAFEGNIKPWLEACKRAKLELGLVGFAVPKRGTPLYARAKELLGR